MKNQQGLLGARRLILCQLGVTIVVALLATLLSSRIAGLSALLGGLVSALPNAYFARTMFQHQGANAAKQIVNGFYKGEALKMVLTIVLFTAVFKFFIIMPLVFFSVYILAQMVFWFAPLMFVSNNNRPKSD